MHILWSEHEMRWSLQVLVSCVTLSNVHKDCFDGEWAWEVERPAASTVQSGRNNDRFRHRKADSHADQNHQLALFQCSSNEDRLHSCQTRWWLTGNRLEATAHPNWPSARVCKQGSLCMPFTCLLGGYELLVHLRKRQVKMNARHLPHQFNTS